MLWPIEKTPSVPDGSDKIVHIFAFTVLSFPLAQTKRFGLLPVLFGASIFGGTIELVQPWFNRSAEPEDWVADCIGVILGIVLGRFYAGFRRDLSNR